MTSTTDVIASDKPALKTQVSYGIGQIAGQVFRDIPSLLLLFFLTNVLGVEPALAGIAIFGPKLIVGVGSDMLVGVLSDKHRDRFGWHHWLLAGAILSPVAMIMLFRVPPTTQGLQVAYIVGIFSFYMAAFSVFSVPYLAIASTLTTDPHQRTVLMAWRLGFTAIGVLIAAGVAPAFTAYLGGDQAAYEAMGVMLALICSLALLIAWWGSRRAARLKTSVRELDAPLVFSFKQLWSALSLPRFSILLGVNILQLAGAGMSYAAMLFFLTYNMGRSDAFSIIGIIVLLSAIGIVIAQPLWVALSRRFGKKRTYLISTLLYAGAIAGWGLCSQFGLYAVYFFAFMLGIGNSGWAMLGFSMVTDIAAKGNGGIYSAVWVAADKVGFALGGTVMVGSTLSLFGFTSANAVAGLPQSAFAITGIMVAFALIPATLNIIAAIAFARWGSAD